MELDILLIGTGSMARAYAAVLKAQNIRAVAIGRSEEHATQFSADTGMPAYGGGLEAWRKSGVKMPQNAIIAVSVQELASVTRAAITAGCRYILLEKPGGLSKRELSALNREVKKNKARVHIAYNRRYYGSVLKAKHLIAEDGGPISFSFIFTERFGVRAKIEKLGTAKSVIEKWFIANSSHVVDLAFYLCGEPHYLIPFAATGPVWKPHPSLFAGSGKTKAGVPFTYTANWERPGPWSVEIGTAHRKVILAPLEMVKEERDGAIRAVDFDDTLDKIYKPGLYREVQNFLSDKSELPTLDKQIDHFFWYDAIVEGKGNTVRKIH